MVDATVLPPQGAREGRLLGVVGTLVWDKISRGNPAAGTLTGWGGIGYALEALTVALPEPWSIGPIVKVGQDRAEEAFRFLRSLPRVRIVPGVVVVPEPNNEVEMRYAGHVRVTERLRGGVPPWTWEELAPLTRECDALYLNFISGFEMELGTARRLRGEFAGPMYADLHSLFLGLGGGGERVPQPLLHWTEWLCCFDAVQMNEAEFALLGHARGDPLKLAADAVGPELKLINVTLGPKGAAYVVSPCFDPDPFTWPLRRGGLAAPGPVRSARVEGAAVAGGEGDPTGCGDVWGASCFSGLLAGSSLEDAMAEANRRAARNVEHRGALGLGRHLDGQIDPARGVK